MKNILVALDLTETDETLIRYAHFLKAQQNLEKVHFVHNIKIYDIDEALKDLLGGKDIHAIIERNLKTKISKLFVETSSYTLHVLEHDSTEFKLNKWAEENSIDTILIGFKQEQFGTGAMAQKLIRIFKSDILLIPENASLSWNRILLPTDLTSQFLKVIKRTQSIVSLLPKVEVRILKSFSIPSLFFPFVDDKKAIEQAQEHIHKQYAEFKKKHSLNPEWTFVARYQDDQSIVDVIRKENKEIKADLIVMAAKGASKISTIFIGSTMNELISSNPFQTIYILK